MEPDSRKDLKNGDAKPLNPWSQRPDLNRGPTDYESVALPTELRWLENDAGVPVAAGVG